MGTSVGYFDTMSDACQTWYYTNRWKQGTTVRLIDFDHNDCWCSNRDAYQNIKYLK